MNLPAITRRIRGCESEVPAQLVLEYAIAEAVAAEREACAKVAEGFDFNSRPEIEPPKTLPRYVAAEIRKRSNVELTGDGQLHRPASE